VSASRSGFDLRDKKALAVFLRKGIAKSTLADYSRLFRTYLQYFGVRRSSGLSGDPYMRDVKSVRVRTMIWVKYIWFLRGVLGVKPRSIGKFLAAAKWELGLRHIALNFADDSLVIVRNAKRAAERLSRSEAREILERSDANLKLPVVNEMLEWLYVNFWTATDWDWEGTLKKAICVAVLVMRMWGLRRSNLVLPGPKSEDHALRAEDIVIVYTDAHGREKATRGGSRTMFEVDPVQVTEMHIEVLSRKWGPDPARQMVSMSNERGRLLIAVVLEWLQRSGVQAMDLLCTCRRVSDANGRLYVRAITGKDVNEAIKDAAVANGLPPEHFASSSMRKGMATNERLRGRSLKKIARTGLWRSIRTIQGHYDFAPRVQRDVDDRAPLRPEEVRRMMAPGAR
jgi:hypothetical protein